MLIYVNTTISGGDFKLNKNEIKNKKIMKTKKLIIDNRPKIKIRLDNKTTVTVRSMYALKSWQERYPEAKIIE